MIIATEDHETDSKRSTENLKVRQFSRLQNFTRSCGQICIKLCAYGNKERHQQVSRTYSIANIVFSFDETPQLQNQLKAGDKNLFEPCVARFGQTTQKISHYGRLVTNRPTYTQRFFNLIYASVQWVFLRCFNATRVIQFIELVMGLTLSIRPVKSPVRSLSGRNHGPGPEVLPQGPDRIRTGPSSNVGQTP